MRHGKFHTPFEQGAGLAPAMSLTQLFDTVSLRIVGPRRGTKSCPRHRFLDGLQTRGDTTVWARILEPTDRSDLDFDVVTP